MRSCLLTAAAAIAVFSAELPVQQVVGPETPTGRYKHPASIAELRNGDLVVAYYGGAGEYAVDTGVFLTRKGREGQGWSTPRLIASDPFRSVGNAVIWEAPDETVWLFYVVRYGKTWSTSRIQAKVSRDGAKTWSDAFVVSHREGYMVRNRPIVLATGEYLLPVYHETGQDTESVGPESTSRFLSWDATDKIWKERGAIRSRNGNIQPAVVELEPGHLVAYCRRGGGYGRTEEGWTVRAESRDRGQTWTEGKASRFRNPNSALELLKLHSGNLLMIFNDSSWRRTPLAAAVSTDADKTWRYRRNIAAAEDKSYAYPFAVQGRDGRIHLVWTGDNRTAIYYTSFEESWLTQQ